MSERLSLRVSSTVRAMVERHEGYASQREHVEAAVLHLATCPHAQPPDVATLAREVAELRARVVALEARVGGEEG